MRIPKNSYFCGKYLYNMKVRLNIKTENCPFFDYYIEAEFPCAPRVGDIITADWDRVRDAIIRDGNVDQYLEYLSEDLRKWYLEPELHETMEKPTFEQLREGLYFGNLGKIESVTWVIEDGVARCETWVEELV